MMTFTYCQHNNTPAIFPSEVQYRETGRPRLENNPHTQELDLMFHNQGGNKSFLTNYLTILWQFYKEQQILSV